ncbi:DNA-processing protein DprA [Flavisolibacter ginsengisoli]|jgi:DNA processing protein|uniref:DNA processing protein n=1 Tax=Flavisolibacter ginsengisoli DSM 18119 TaxID=1121884 RepID=A0A1M5D5M5_9BACT|nr:DNA-processing protein DprA [Flavisolibacter ginsengisoli]SHF61982.1 DNA processing protein [Flavisolibacter ginsengisoli DSM 18119]
MSSELFYQLALTLVPNIGDVHAKVLLQQFGNASTIFKAPHKELERLEGIGMVRANSIRTFNDFYLVEAELRFIEKYKIKTLFLTDPEYPQRLLNCYDSPTLLFYKGTADLNASKVVAVVGTRSNTEYGKQYTEDLIAALSSQQVLIISGLAIGIDAYAHKAALKNDLPTVGVVGHGLDKIYPSVNKGLARDMALQNGGILSEFFSGTLPDKHNFPLRNRIVAGMSDATIVVETLVSGGSMITAKLADAYNRDVFAVPGRTTDTKSKGCNYLIKNNKAILLTDAAQLLDIMGWQEKKKKVKKQKELFIELTPEEKQVIDILKQKESVHIDEINISSGLSSSAVAAAILNLELQSVIGSMPGKMYKLL